MDGYLTVDLADRDLRRRQLAYRLVRHQARTRTISRLTGLSRHQQATLRHRWGVTSDMRPRGRIPRSFAVFQSTAQLRAEAAVLAVIWRVLANTGGDPHSTQAKLSGVVLGEHLCEAYEAYVTAFPEAELGLEDLVQIVRGLERGEVIALSWCGRCGAVILVDLLSTGRRLCCHCLHPTESVLPISAQEADAMQPCSPLQQSGEVGQQELF